MIRRPPRSTLFPYNDALPISPPLPLPRGMTRIAVVLIVLAGLGGWLTPSAAQKRSEEHTSELQSRLQLVCRLLLEKKKKKHKPHRCLAPMASISPNMAELPVS